jgi:PAS domain S-box-containing protein
MSAELLIRLPDYFPSLINAMQDGFLLRGIDGTIVEVNDAFCRMIGYDRSEIIGRRPPHDWWAAEDRERFDDAFQRYLSGVAAEDRLTYTRRNGQPFPTLVTSAPLRDAEGRIIGFIGMIKDISEHTRVERQIAFQAQLIDRVPAAVIATDDQGVITLWSTGAEQLFGWARHDVIGVDIGNLMSGRQAPGWSTSMLAALRAGTAWEGELDAQHRDGSDIPIFISNAPILDPSGALVGVVGVAVDITARRRAEQRFTAQHAVTRALADADTLERGITTLLQTLGTHLGWSIGVAWLLDEQRTVLRCHGVWCDPALAATSDLLEDLAMGREFTYGEGLLGQVWATGRPTWHTNLGQLDGFLRAQPARRAQMESWLGFPILGSRHLLGVVEFFARTGDTAEPELADMLSTIGRQLGQFIERRRAENALRESELRFRAMADSAPVLLWMSGPGPEMTWFNKVWLDFTGRTMEDEVRHGWLASLHPDDLDRFHSAYATAFTARQPFSLEFRLRRYDGEYRWLLGSGTPRLGPDSQFEGMIGSCIDITERRQHEEDQHFLSEATRILASSLDYHTTLTSVAQLAVTGFADWCVVHLTTESGEIEPTVTAHVDPRKVERARELQALFPPDLQATQGLANVVRTGRPELVPVVTDEQLRASARNPEHLALLREVGLASVMIVPIQARGHVLGAITLAAAESGRHYGPRELAVAEHLGRRAAVAIDNARLYEEAQEAARARDQFLAVAAHELRSPLTSMKGFAQLLLRRAARTPGGEEWVRPLQTIDTQVNRVAGLVNRLLDVSRIEEKRLHLEVSEVDMVEVVRNAVAEAQLGSEDHQIRALLHTETLPAEIDRSRIEQVLSNLIDNALKYSPPGTFVDVSLRPVGDELEVAVRDHGTGIDEETRAGLFERYFRGRAATRATSDGLGLGLYVAHGIVEAHHGSMTVESEPGYGSIFSFRIPCRQPAVTGTGPSQAVVRS